MDAATDTMARTQMKVFGRSRRGEMGIRFVHADRNRVPRGYYHLFPSSPAVRRFQSVPALVLRFPPMLPTVLLMAAGSLHAQPEPTLERGSFIEIVSECLNGGIGVGWLRTFTKDSLTYIDSVSVTTIALEDIGQLRVNVGRDGGTLNAATVAGAVLGAAIGAMAKPESHECLSSLASEADCGEEVPAELVGAVIGGGLLRLLARSSLKERWVNVNLNRLIYRPESELP